MNHRSHLSLILVLGGLASCSPATQDTPPTATATASSMPVVAMDGKVRSKEEKRLGFDNPSTPQAVTLALAFFKASAKVYTAYWCPHCHEQGELFGKEAFAIVAPVECAKDGKNSQVKLCKATAKKVGEDFGFPTWEINGRFYPGVQPIDRDHWTQITSAIN
jgi:glutaredoxin